MKLKKNKIDFKNKKTWPFITTTVGCLLFIILTTIAMFFYTGGTEIDPNSKGYNFFLNYFSDLGLTISHAGASNLTSSVLFAISTFITGIVLIPFFTAMVLNFPGNQRKKLIALVLNIIVIIAAIGFIGIGFTPSNLYKSLHGNCVKVAFFGTFLVILTYAIIMVKDKRFPRYLPTVFFIFAIITLSYIILLFFRPPTIEPLYLKINVVGQKLVIYTAMISMIIGGYSMAIFVNNI